MASCSLTTYSSSSSSSSFKSASSFIKIQSDLEKYANFLENVKSFKSLDTTNNDGQITTLNRNFRVQEVDRVYLAVELEKCFDNCYNFSLYCRLKGDIPVYVYIYYKRSPSFKYYRSWYTYDPNIFIREILYDCDVNYRNTETPILRLFQQDGIRSYVSRG